MSNLLTLKDHIVIGQRKVHPLADQINNNTEQLCKEFGIYYNKFHERNTMLAYVVPGGNPDHLITLNFYTNFLWYIDDMYDRNDLDMQIQGYDLRQFYKLCTEIMLTGKMPQDQHILFDVCYELYKRFKIQTTYQSWLTTFIHHTVNHLQFSTTDFEDTFIDGKPSIERYIQLREQDSGMYPTVFYIPFAYQIDLSKAASYNEELKQINQLTVQIGALSNDIFSYEKEVLRLGSKFNLIAVIQAAKNLDLKESISEAVAIVNRKSQEFEELYGILHNHPDLDDRIKIHIDGLRDLCSATYYWQISTNRYRSPQSPHPVLQQMLPTDDFFTGNQPIF